jgi:PIN domain nuclease of toxin-antitoxin system
VTFVLDACAIIAFLNNEPGGEAVGLLLAGQGDSCVVHGVNLCEVYYDLARAAGQPTAQRIIGSLVRAGLIAREDMDTDFWQRAGDLKGQLARISIADCFCVALANRLDAEIVTADHAEFEQIADGGIARVRFLR